MQKKYPSVVAVVVGVRSQLLTRLTRGDKGKGKIARFNGGANAGHTIKFEGKTFKFNLLPSGITQPGKMNVIGNGCVVHLPRLFEELANLDKQGIDWKGRLLMSKRTHLLFDFHQEIDGMRESNLGKKKIGTTKRGIGPCYSSKMTRHNIRAGDIEFFDKFKEKLTTLATELMAMYKFKIDIEKEIARYEKFREMLLPMLTDSVEFMHNALKSHKNILLEGANAIMLDIDFGTYPYVTSSNTGVSGCSSGLGIPPKKITNCCGIMKAYCTRVGEGPFPTEIEGEDQGRLRKEGKEFGVTTGRPRRCGWLDLVQIRYANKINDFDTIGMTKLDVLNIFDEIKVGVGYKYKGEVVKNFPSQLEVLEDVEVEYETFKGWKGVDLTNVRKFSDLPREARVFVKRVEELINIPIKWIGIGPSREQIIVQYPFLFE